MMLNIYLLKATQLIHPRFTLRIMRESTGFHRNSPVLTSLSNVYAMEHCASQYIMCWREDVVGRLLQCSLLGIWSRRLIITLIRVDAGQ
jgi:hypothetical protein